MPCIEFEDLLLDYRELDSEKLRAADAHLAACADCRAFLQALDEVDVSLTKLFAGYEVSPKFRQSVLRRLQGHGERQRPSFIPEVLDFIGWAAIFAIIACLVAQVSPPIQFGSYALWIAGFSFLATGLLFGLHAYAELKPPD